MKNYKGGLFLVSFQFFFFFVAIFATEILQRKHDLKWVNLLIAN